MRSQHVSHARAVSGHSFSSPVTHDTMHTFMSDITYHVTPSYIYAGWLIVTCDDKRVLCDDGVLTCMKVGMNGFFSS